MKYGHAVKTTLVLGDEVAKQLKDVAREEGRSMSSVVEEALLLLLSQRGLVHEPIDLPVFHGGPPRVDVADRAALLDVLTGDVDAS